MRVNARSRGEGQVVKVAVIGATGNLGTAVVRALGDEPAIDAIVGIARRRPQWDPPKTQWVEADIVEDDLVPLLDGADAVVHLAWAMQPMRRPLQTWQVNAVGSERVFAAAAEAGAGVLVYGSSVGAYSPGPKERRVDESWPTDGFPTAPYGREKAYVERALDAFEARHPEIRTVRLRPGFVFQKWSASEQRRIMLGRLLPPSLLRRAFLPIVPRTDGLRQQFVHADDLAEAFRLALTRDVRGAFNVAADPPVGPDELAEVFHAKVVPVPRPLVRAAVATAFHLRLLPMSPHMLDLALELPLMDTTRARRELGWEPRHTSLDALRALVEGFENRHGGPTPPLESAA